MFMSKPSLELRHAGSDIRNPKAVPSFKGYDSFPAYRCASVIEDISHAVQKVAEDAGFSIVHDRHNGRRVREFDKT